MKVVGVGKDRAIVEKVLKACGAETASIAVEKVPPKTVDGDLKDQSNVRVCRLGRCRSRNTGRTDHCQGTQEKRREPSKHIDSLHTRQPLGVARPFLVLFLLGLDLVAEFEGKQRHQDL